MQQSPNFWRMIDIFIRKANSTHACFKIFIIGSNLENNLIKKEVILVYRIDLGSKI